MGDTVGPNKAIAAGLAGAATVIVVWCLHQFAHLDIPLEVSGALTVLASTGLAWLVPHGGNG